MADVRPIDANAFIADLKDEAVNLYLNGLKGTPRDYKFLYDIVDRVGEQPTLTDYEPVVHGRWEYSLGSYSTPKCSCCGWHIPYSDDSVLDARNYCPNCGAKMDGGSE